MLVSVNKCFVKSKPNTLIKKHTKKQTKKQKLSITIVVSKCYLITITDRLLYVYFWKSLDIMVFTILKYQSFPLNIVILLETAVVCGCRVIQPPGCAIYTEIPGTGFCIIMIMNVHIGTRVVTILGTRTPVGTRRNHNVMMTSKRRRNVVLTS